MSDQATVERNVCALKNLPKGWCYGEGGPISESVIRGAYKLVAAAFEDGRTRVDTFPGVDGAVSVVIYEGQHDHSFGVQPDGEVWYWDESSRANEEETLSVEQAITKIKSLPHEN